MMDAPPLVRTRHGLIDSSNTMVSQQDVQDMENVWIPFSSVQELFSIIERSTKDILFVSGVTLRDYENLQTERARRPRQRVRFRRFHAATKRLVIAIPLGSHEDLHTGLYDLIRDNAGMTSQNWKGRGATIFRAHVGALSSLSGIGDGGNEGEADASGEPITDPYVPRPWPTLVIESGLSESLAQLRMDMGWWFSASDHAVKIVVLVKLDREGGLITIEAYEEAPQMLQAGVTTTRSAGGLTPVLRQQVCIMKDRAVAGIDAYEVTRGDLVLSRRLLFLRDLAPGEGDVIISVRDLQNYAHVIWTGMG